jgi:hypothetical protein
MFQYMVALKFHSMVPGCRIANVALPEWGIEHPPLESPGPEEIVAGQHAIDLDGLTERARAGAVRRVVYAGFGQRMENLLDAGVYRNVFRPPVAAASEFDERHLICPIGASDASEQPGPFHPLTPVEFYADIVAETGLTPVFIGPGVPSLYADRLRTQFPQARFLDTGSAMADFEAIRQAKNIVVGVSAFAWLAAWLSHADRIFMAVSGLFNPLQYGFVDLLPFDDPRYRFCLFPINYAVPLEHHAAAHRRIAPFWRPVSHAALKRQLQEAPRLDPSNEEILANFDADYYLATNTDVAQILGAGNTEGARAHYLLFGIREQRLPFKLAPAWYAARYPMAAFEVAQGDYSNFAHHYIAVGRARGYRPLPIDGESWWD